MDATYIQQSIEQLKLDIFKNVHHRTLLKYTREPIIDENQLFFLLLPFFNGEQWDDALYESIITVAIVHASLYEHDKINEFDATSKEQQLTVLAGDYYSGRYYEILAQSGNIPLIRHLSEGIIERCEHQVKVYEPSKMTINQWFECLKVIESKLIEKFYNANQFNQYIPIMEKSLMILRLQEELNNHLNGKDSIFVERMMECIDQNNEDAPFKQYILKEIDWLFTHLYEELNSTHLLNEELKLYIQGNFR